MLNFKNITDVPVVEELPEGSSLIVNDNGQAKQIAADDFVPKKSGSSGADIEANVCVVAEKDWELEYGTYVFDIDFLEGSTIAVNGTFEELKQKIKNFGNITIQGGLKYARKDVNDHIMYYPFNFDLNKIFGGTTTLVNSDMIIEFEYLSELAMTKEEFDDLSDDAYLEFPYLEEPEITMSRGDWFGYIGRTMFEYDELDSESFQELSDDSPLFIRMESSGTGLEFAYQYILPTTKAKFLANLGVTEEEFLDGDSWDTYFTYTISNSITKKELIDSIKDWFIERVGFEECITLYDLNNLYGEGNVYNFILGGGCFDGVFGFYIFPDPDDENGVILKVGIPIDVMVIMGY